MDHPCSVTFPVILKSHQGAYILIKKFKVFFGSEMSNTLPHFKVTLEFNSAFEIYLTVKHKF